MNKLALKILAPCLSNSRWTGMLYTQFVVVSQVETHRYTSMIRRFQSTLTRFRMLAFKQQFGLVVHTQV